MNFYSIDPSLLSRCVYVYFSIIALLLFSLLRISFLDMVSFILHWVRTPTNVFFRARAFQMELPLMLCARIRYLLFSLWKIILDENTFALNNTKNSYNAPQTHSLNSLFFSLALSHFRSSFVRLLSIYFHESLTISLRDSQTKSRNSSEYILYKYEEWK